MNRNQLVWGLILIAAGVGFLALQLFPGLFDRLSWPWIMIAIGLVFAVASLLSRVGGLMIPGVIVGGLGAIFLWQEGPGDPSSWSYVWTLIPGFVGLGMLIGSLYDADLREARGAGVGLILLSAIGFAIFGGLLGVNANLLQYWPVLLIVVGGIVLLRSLLGARESKQNETDPIKK